MRSPDAYNDRVKDYVRRYASPEDAARAGTDGKEGDSEEDEDGDSEDDSDAEMSDAGSGEDDEVAGGMEL